MTTPSTGTGTPGTSLTPGGAGSGAQSRTDQVAGVLVTPVALAQRVLPANRCRSLSAPAPCCSPG